MSGKRRNETGATISAWWDGVLAGDVDEPHPILGEQLTVRLTDGRLHLFGELERPEDREALIRQARAHVGHGVHQIDVSGLRVRGRHERRGILDQTLVAAYQHRDTAELARKFVLEHSRVTPKHDEIVEPKESGRLGRLLPRELVEDAKKLLGRQYSLLVIRVDETDAYRVRALLEEETHSTWTIASPPRVATHRK